MRRRNIQHGQKRRYVSRWEVGCLGILIAVGISALMLLAAPMFGGA